MHLLKLDLNFLDRAQANIPYISLNWDKGQESFQNNEFVFFFDVKLQQNLSKIDYIYIK